MGFTANMFVTLNLLSDCTLVTGVVSLNNDSLNFR